ncbi:MAG: hypothetical protein MR717_05580 [Prevotella sp.]|nr:hypothetical protein [Prevotella sp.]MDD5895510.1 hypothetical protein [Prevotellaceae bacterium]
MEETLNDNSRQKEVKAIGLSFIKRGIAYVVLLFAAAMAIAYASGNEWIIVPAIVSALYTLAIVVAEGLLWGRVASRSVDALTTFYSAVSGFRMLLTIVVMFGYYLAFGRDGMLGFLSVLAPFYVVMLVHHSIFFGMKSKIIDKFNNVKQHS